MTTSKELMHLREQLSFLGYEFLSWTFLLLDRDTAKEDVAAITKNILRNEDPSLSLGTKLVTTSLINREQKTSVACPILEESHEVFASLRNGHVIESLSLSMSFGGVVVECTLMAQDFALTGVKIKNAYDAEPMSAKDEDLSEEDAIREDVFLRMAAVRDAEKIIDGLFSHFVTLRVDSSYANVVRAMREQVDLRLGNYLKKRDGGQAQPLYAIG